MCALQPLPASAKRQSVVFSGCDSETSARQRVCIAPLKSCTPTIPKTKKMKMHRRNTEVIAGMASRSEPTSTFIPGTRFTVRSGRNARTARTAGRVSLSGRNSVTHALTTSRKSSQFHAERR
eukprot:6197296-Pleurochrysis_carterae.AAC.3